MKKITKMLMIFAFSQNINASSWDAFDGSHGYYAIDTNRVTQLQESIQEIDTPAANLCKDIIQRAKRTIKPYQEDLSVNAACSACSYPDFGPTRKALNAEGYGSKTNEEQWSILERVLTPPAFHEMQKSVEAARLKRAKLEAEYDQYRILGPWRLSTFRNFINKSILGITGIFPMEGSDNLFGLMKATGFLEIGASSIETYSYSEQIAAREFLMANPSIHTLVLACGSFVPSSVSYSLCGINEGGCGSCKDGHHSSKGEMTVSLPESAEFDIEYEEGAASDVIGNITHPAFWAGVVEGLSGRKFTCVKDHSYVDSLLDVYLRHLHQVLALDGIFEIGRYSKDQSLIDQLQTHGFNFQSFGNDTMRFIYQPGG